MLEPGHPLGLGIESDPAVVVSAQCGSVTIVDHYHDDGDSVILAVSTQEITNGIRKELSDVYSRQPRSN